MANRNVEAGIYWSMLQPRLIDRETCALITVSSCVVYVPFDHRLPASHLCLTTINDSQSTTNAARRVAGGRGGNDDDDDVEIKSKT
jgi:hypothetical protein